MSDSVIGDFVACRTVADPEKWVQWGTFTNVCRGWAFAHHGALPSYAEIAEWLRAAGHLVTSRRVYGLSLLPREEE